MAALGLALDQSLCKARHAFGFHIGEGEAEVVFLGWAEHRTGEAEEIVLFGEAHGDGLGRLTQKRVLHVGEISAAAD